MIEPFDMLVFLSIPPSLEKSTFLDNRLFIILPDIEVKAMLFALIEALRFLISLVANSLRSSSAWINPPILFISFEASMSMFSPAWIEPEFSRVATFRFILPPAII